MIKVYKCKDNKKYVILNDKTFKTIELRRLEDFSGYYEHERESATLFLFFNDMEKYTEIARFDTPGKIDFRKSNPEMFV